MQFLAELSRLIGKKQQRSVPPPRSVLPPSPSPEEATAPPQQSATRPTRRIEDHHLLKLHKVIDQSG